MPSRTPGAASPQRDYARVVLPVNITLAAVLTALLAAAVSVAAVARLGEGQEHRQTGKPACGGTGEGGGKGRKTLGGSPHARAIATAGLRAAAQLAAVSLVIGYVVRAVPLLLAFVALMFAVAARTAGRRITHNRTWRWAAAPIAAGVAPVVAVLLLTGLDQTRTVGLVTLPGAYVGMLLGGASPVEAGAVQLFVLVALMAVQAVAVAVVLELVARGRVHRLHSGTSEGE